MKPYTELQKIYRESVNWDTFVNNVSTGRGKQIILSVLEEGWKSKLQNDLQYLYDITKQQVTIFLNRLECIRLSTPTQYSATELALQLSDLKNSINVVRGYVRYAYYVAVDDEDTVIAKLDEVLAVLGEGTPTRKECMESYTMITGKYIDASTVVVDANSADEVAVILVANVEQLQRKLEFVDAEVREQIKMEIHRLNELHVKLTGKNIITV